MLSNKTILIADDSNFNRMMLREILKNDYNIIEADNGIQVMEILKNDSSDISLVILDVQMPGMGGLDVLKAMQADVVLQQIPVIICSGDDEVNDEIKMLELGARYFISKTYNVKKLMAYIKNLIANAQRERERSNYYDWVTGIYSAETFYVKTALLLRNNSSVAYAIVRWNIARFKAINDIFGIEKGNAILKCIANAIRERYEIEGYTFARLEADHFVIAIPCSEFNIDDFIKFADTSLNNVIENYKIISNFGVYIVEDITTPVELMCDRANLALTFSKGNYTVPFAVYDENMRKKMFVQQEIMRDMEGALEKNQFKIYYQPIVDVFKNVVVSAEALVRWIHPERGMISPSDFIPVFEENGFITKLDEYILKAVCYQQAVWKHRKKPLVPISVNLSRVSICNPNIVDIILGLLEEYSLESKYLAIEITETVYTKDSEILLDVMKKLQAKGINFLMDDFGSGYSSLNMLKDVPFDILKIDLEFLSDFEKAKRSGVIVSSIVKMANQIKIAVVAEGVETKAQLEFLRSIGCAKMQGYYFFKPMTGMDFEILFAVTLESIPKEISREKTILEFDEIFTQNFLAQKIFNATDYGVAIYEIQGKNLKALKVNEGYYNVLRMEQGDIYLNTLSLSDNLAFSEDKAQLEFACNKAVNEDTPQIIVVRKYDKNNNLIFYRLNIEYLGLSEEVPLICIIICDITTLMTNTNSRYENSDEELKRKYERYNVALSQWNTVIFEWDINSGTLYYDDSFKEYLLSRENPVDLFNGRMTNTSVHYLDIPIMTELLTKSSSSNEKESAKVRLIKVNGEAVWCEIAITYVFESNKRVRAICTINEIDELVKNNQKLVYQEKLYRLVNRDSIDLIFDLDVDEDTMTYSFKIGTGEHKEIKVSNYVKYLPDSTVIENESKARFIATVKKAIEGEPISVIEYRADFNGEGFKWHRAIISIITDSRGRVYRIVGRSDEIQKEKDQLQNFIKESGYLSALVGEGLFAYEYNFNTKEKNLINATEKFKKNFLTYQEYMAGENFVNVVHDDDKQEVQRVFSDENILKEFRQGKKVVKISCRIKDRNGNWLWIEISSYIIKIQDSDSTHALVYAKLIDTEKKAHEELVQKAKFDAVSGIYNRATFEATVNEQMADAETDATFFIIDIDNFKAINDTMGHLQGDNFIKSVANILSEYPQENDIVGRLGGDEFAILFMSLKSDTEVMEISKAIINEIYNKAQKMNSSIKVSASVGICRADKGTGFTEICSKADEALYKAKNSGRGKAVIYSQS